MSARLYSKDDSPGGRKLRECSRCHRRAYRVIVSSGDKTYASNAGSATLSAYRYDHHGNLTSIGTFGTGPGTVDAAISSDGRYLYAQTGGTGSVDTFRIHNGALSLIGTVTVPNGIGADGIAAD